MLNKDVLHEILTLRRQCLNKIEDENQEINHLHEELNKWRENLYQELEMFIEKKFEEIKQKTQHIHQEQIRYLDQLYSACLSNTDQSITEQTYSQLIDNFHETNHPIQIVYPKPINFNEYLQLNTTHTDKSLCLKKKLPCRNLSTYELISTLPIHSNITSLFTTYDRLLLYTDHDTSLASLYIFALQPNSNQSILKFRVPCKKYFQGKILHMEYSTYLEGFLLSTASKFFLLQIPNSCTRYRLQEYCDMIQGNFLGILQKFACHPNETHLLYLLMNSLSDQILIQIDLSECFQMKNQWIYPSTEQLDHENQLQLKTIDDFVLGKDFLLFAVTYQSNKNNQLCSQLHLRSTDMILQHRFVLKSSSFPRQICLIPSDEYQQFLLISQKSSTLSFYDITNTQIQLVDEILLDSEPEYISFQNHDPSIFLLRNLFHIAIYKQLETNQFSRDHLSILLDQRLNIRTNRRS